MFEGEIFDDFYTKLNSIVNSAFNLGKFMINLRLLGRFLDP